MAVLVLCATGMTGTPLVHQLLDGGHKVRIVVRSTDKLSKELLDNSNLIVLKAAVLDLNESELKTLTDDCDAVVSCLGHTMDFRGFFGKPRNLCTDAVHRVCDAIHQNNPKKPVRLILMNTVGVASPSVDQKRTLFERFVLTLLRILIPPHRDNETAAAFLRHEIGEKRGTIEWCIVRPDSLINAQISNYDVVAAPTTGIFSGRPTTRANVASLMMSLIETSTLWEKWKFRSPVVMDSL